MLGQKIKIVCPTHKLTNQTKDAQDGGGKNDKQVNRCQQHSSDDDVPNPAEVLVLKQHLLNGATHLEDRGKLQKLSIALKLT